MIPEEPLAQALEKYAIAEEKVGEARLAQDAAIQSRFLAGWSTTLNTNLMFAKRARTGVENARLHLDATKAKAKAGPGFNLGGTTSPREQTGDDEMSEATRDKIEKAEDEFVAQTEEAVGVMKNVLDTPEPLRNLADLIAAQLEYHKRAYEILSELAPVVDQLQVEQEVSISFFFLLLRRMRSILGESFTNKSDRQITAKPAKVLEYSELRQMGEHWTQQCLPPLT